MLILSIWGCMFQKWNESRIEHNESDPETALIATGIYGVANFDDDEKDVTINKGRYKFKVVAEDFYEWEEMAQSSSNSKDVVDIIEFIKKSLGFTT